MNPFKRPPFPTAIDSSMHSTFKQCPMKFMYSYMLSLRPGGTSVDLVAGGAFAAGLEYARRSYYERGSSLAHAHRVGFAHLTAAYGVDEKVPNHEKKPWRRVAGAYDAYFERFPMDRDAVQPYRVGDTYGIEFTFAIPIDVNHPETGDPILVCGKSDLLGTMGSAVYVVDEKTTMYLGEQWSSKWDLRGQFACYTWAARQHDIPAQGTIVRGVAFRKAGHYDFAEAIPQFKPWQLDRWYQQFNRDVERMVEMWKNWDFDYDLAYSCEMCYYKMPCNAPPESREAWMRVQGYEYAPWNPLEKKESGLVIL